MNLLILGGGVFLGAAALQSAMARGHTVTVFNRGRSRSVWPGGVDVLSGDRSTELVALQGRNWDAVIDTCGYVPADVQASAESLACLRLLSVRLQHLGLRHDDAGAGARDRRARTLRAARP
jgi:2'-hydroxyisoflavone reductase